jgi:hypothetical protein
MSSHSSVAATAKQEIMRQRTERASVGAGDLAMLFSPVEAEIGRWLADPRVELATDVGVTDLDGIPAVQFGKPVRIEIFEPAGTVAMAVRPLAAKRNVAAIWASPAAERLDYFQVINQRVQNYYPHLRRMPGTYSLDTWSKEELDAVAPTNIARFHLPSSRWSNLVVTWGPNGYRGQETVTRAFLDGILVAESQGILHKLLLTWNDVREQFSQQANVLWHRMALLCGVAVGRFVLLTKALEIPQAEALSRSPWRDTASLLRAIPGFSPSEPDLEDIYANAPGVRVRATDCEPVANALPLEERKGDRFRYWHFEAKDAIGKQALSCIPDGAPLRWHADVPEDGVFSLALHYELMLPPTATSPCVSVAIDGACPDESLRDVPLPPTTASGAQRPEPGRYKAVPLTPSASIPLEAGRHELALTFSGKETPAAKDALPADILRNGFLILDEILLTPWSLGALPEPEGLFRNYLRPPDMLVQRLEERPDATVYTLAFFNAEAAPVAGTLAIDESTDPGPEPSLSAARLEFSAAGQSTEVILQVPVDPSTTRVRRIRLVFAEDRGTTRKTYFLRHRRPFLTRPRPQKLANLGLLGFERWQSMPEAARQATIQRLRADKALAPWRDRTPAEILADPPTLLIGHGNAIIKDMAVLLTLTHDPKVAANLKSILLAHTRLVARRKPQNADGEKRDGVFSDYGGGRRGGLFGDIFPEDILAYDALLASAALFFEDQMEIEGNLFWNGYENSKRFGGELLYRGQAVGAIYSALLGVLLDDEPMLEEAELTALRFGKWQVFTDGGHNEKASSYGTSVWTLVEVAALLRRFGRPKVFETLRDTIRAAVTAMFRWSFSDGSILRQGDGGIQRSFHIFGYGSRTELARELFPGDREIEQYFEYGDALQRRLQAKWDHKPPSEWPPLPPEMLRKSDLFPEAGWVILRSGPGADRVEVSLDWSAFGDHGHPDKLNSVLFAFDEVMSMDLSYGWSPDNHRSQGYAMRTVCHNTVVADMVCQLPGSKGALWLFDHQPDVQVAWADAGPCYQDGIQADRCLMLLSDAVVDLFRLSGGRIHQYDWLFHCLGEMAGNVPLAARGPLCPALRPFEKVTDFPGYELLTGMREGQTDGDAHFSWRLDGYPQMPGYWTDKTMLEYPLGTVHLAVVGAPGTTCVAGLAPFPLPTPDSFRPFLMVRRSVRDALFAAVFQARSVPGAAPATVCSVPVLQRGRPLEPHQATAVQLRSAQKVVTVVQKHVPGSISAGPVRSTDAALLVLCQGGHGTPVTTHAWNACRVEIDGAEPWSSPLPGQLHRSKA